MLSSETRRGATRRHLQYYRGLRTGRRGLPRCRDGTSRSLLNRAVGGMAFFLTAIIFLSLLMPGGWSNPTPADAAGWSIFEIQHPADEPLPYKLTERYLLFGAGEGSESELYLYDLAAATTERLTTNSYADTDADMEGSRIVWSGNVDGDYEVFMHDLSTGQTTRLTTNSTDDRGVCIAGDCVAWVGYDGSDSEIFLYRMGSHQLLQLTDDSWIDGEFYWVSTDGEFVCWASGLPGGQPTRVNVYRVESKDIVYDDSGDGNAWCQVDDGQAVYVGSVGSGSYIFHADLTQTPIKPATLSPLDEICSFPTSGMVPVVDDGYVVWMAGTPGSLRVALCQLDTGTIRIIGGPADISWAQISGGVAAWIQQEDGKGEVWVRRITSGASERLTDDDLDQEYVLAGPVGATWTQLGASGGSELWLALHGADEGRIFVDVPFSNPYCTAIEGLYLSGVVNGTHVVDDNRYFSPNDPLKRAQFAKMIIGALGLPPSPTTETRFVDLGQPDASGYPHIYVQSAWEHGITYGKNLAQTLYAPWDYIRRDQVVSMIVRAAENQAPGLLDAPSPGTPSLFEEVPLPHGPNLRIAEYNGLLDGLTGLGPSWSFIAEASREEAAQMLWNLRTKVFSE